MGGQEFMDGLVTASREHISFLNAVHLCVKDLYSNTVDLKYAIAEYVGGWLPMLNCCIDSVTMTERIQRKTACVVPVPPLDVAWVWYLHKLDPKSYQTDCCQWYGHILDAPLGVSPFRYTSAVSSRVDHEFYPCASMYDEFIERISAIASKQSSFLWNVRSPEFGDTCFLRESVSRYETMLKLAKNDPKECTAVSYAVENVWRAHLSFPRQYLEDCLRLTGRCVDHDSIHGTIIRDGTVLSTPLFIMMQS